MDDLSRLAGLLRRLTEETGKSFVPDSFQNRLRIQKSVYLLGALGLPLARRYAFTYYYRGPYSPVLSHDYYALKKRPVNPTHTRIPPVTLRMVKECIARGDTFLEAVSTVHSIATDMSPHLDKDETFRIAMLLKPQLKGRYEKAWDYLCEAGLL